MYYSAAPSQQAALNDFEARKRGFEALDHFFGEVKAGRFAPLSYQTISQRLFELQGLQLPIITQPPLSAIPAYQPVVAMAGAVGGYNSNDPLQGYSLPPMGNAKSRGDLTSIDRILEQMQAAIYENDSQLAQAGVAQPGAHYVNYRTSDTSPGVQLPSSHAQTTPMMSQHQHNPSLASATDSVHSSTPALTPPSSAQSYTSGHSPISHNITLLQGPTSGGPGAGANAMYPTLPTATMDNGYSPSAPNAATLGGLYDGEEHRRRYSGGLLQRAQPGPRRASGDATDGASNGTPTPPATALKAAAHKRRRGAALAAAAANNSVIDPALSGMGPTSEESAAAAVAAAGLKSPASNGSGGEITDRDAEQERNWVDNMRLIEWMRKYVKGRLEEGDFDEDEQHKKDVEMGEGEVEDGVEGGVEGEGEAEKGNDKGKDDLYPSLKGVGN